MHRKNCGPFTMKRKEFRASFKHSFCLNMNYIFKLDKRNQVQVNISYLLHVYNTEYYINISFHYNL